MTVLTVFVAIIAVCDLIVLLSIAILAFSLSRAVNKTVTPAINEARATVQQLNELLERVEGRADRIMEIGESTVQQVSGKVSATADMVENSITEPIISVSSLLAGVSRAIETWRASSAQMQ